MEPYETGTVLVCPNCLWEYKVPITTTSVLCAGGHRRASLTHKPTAMKPKHY